MKFSREKIIGYMLILAFVGGAVALEFLLPDPVEEAKIIPKASSEERIAKKFDMYPFAREIVAPAGFINTQNGEPITIEELIGKKVILLDIWTYSCINCQRTFPYLRAWYDTYADDGLAIIGIHSPEFEFEKDIVNVRAAVLEAGIKYPVVLDNQRATWDAYQNQYWPRKFLIDIDGFVVYDKIGEGGYDETEAAIQAALRERAEVLGEEFSLGSATIEGIETLDRTRPHTPEIYLGAWRNEALANGEQLREGAFTYDVPSEPLRDSLYLDGAWDIAYEFARNTTPAAKIVVSYQASKLFMVLAPVDASRPVRARVLLDGEPIIQADAGEDVIFGDGDPYILVDEDRMYRIIESEAGWGQYLFELIIDIPGLEAYTFAFG